MEKALDTIGTIAIWALVVFGLGSTLALMSLALNGSL
jgi:hypothetical protein